MEALKEKVQGVKQLAGSEFARIGKSLVFKQGIHKDRAF
jgi:hypothetical protein